MSTPEWERLLRAHALNRGNDAWLCGYTITRINGYGTDYDHLAAAEAVIAMMILTEPNAGCVVGMGRVLKVKLIVGEVYDATHGKVGAAG